jgi:two-component system nitrogen regulation response regulator GlnG
MRAEEVALALSQFGDIHRTNDFSALADACQRHMPLAVVLAIPEGRMEGCPDSRLLTFLGRLQGRTAVVLYSPTRQQSSESLCAVLTAGAHHVLDADAPSFVAKLQGLLSNLIRAARLRFDQQRSQALLFAERGLVGDSPAMRDVFRRALKASRFSNLPVLIVGEPGTPRRLLAAAIHRLDARRASVPLRVLDCEDLGPPLTVSSGTNLPAALRQWRALLRAAHGGTVFLDHIDALAPSVQHILVAALRDRRLPADGATPAGSLDVRLMAGSEFPPEVVPGGYLDPALRAQLELFRVRLPGLRGRPQDIAAQARHFLRLSQRGRERAITDIAPDALEALQRLRWEQNTSELERTLRLVLATKSRGGILTLEDFPEWVRAARTADLPEPVPHPADAVGDELFNTSDLDIDAMEYEARLRAEVLQQRRGHS